MKRLLLLILMCFSLVISADARMSLMQLAGETTAAGKATITYDTANSGTTAGTDTCTVAIDPGNGNSDKIVIIGVGWEKASGAATISSMTYDGNAATLVDTQTFVGETNYDGVALYYYLAPSDDSKNVVVTMSAGVQGISLGVISLYNVKQQAPEANNKATGESTTAAVTVTTLTDGAWVVDVVSNLSSTTANTPTTMTERWTASADQTTDASTILDVTHGAQPMSWTVAASKVWGIVAAAFEAADL